MRWFKDEIMPAIKNKENKLEPLFSKGDTFLYHEIVGIYPKEFFKVKNKDMCIVDLETQPIQKHQELILKDDTQ